MIPTNEDPSKVNQKLINLIPRNKYGHPKNRRLQEIWKLLSFYSFSEMELGFLKKEIESYLSKKPETEF